MSQSTKPEIDIEAQKEMIESFHPIDGQRLRNNYEKWESTKRVIPTLFLIIAFFTLLLLIIFSPTYQRWFFMGMVIIAGIYGKREGHWEGYRDGYIDGREKGIEISIGKITGHDEKEEKNK